MKLLNPGPVTLSERVRQALLREDLCHREPEFARLQQRIRAALLGVYDLDPAEWAAILLTGSGTAAVEAMLSSLVPANGRLAVVANGVYGERMARIAETYGIDTARAAHAWVEAIDVSRLDANARQIAVVHHETTTGRLNDLSAVAATHDARLLVDAVSSFGAEAIDFEGWRIDALAGTANKCLHGVPGTSFVIARRPVIERATARTVYLNLATYLAAQDTGSTPFTQSVQTFYALDEALAELAGAGGWQRRRERYRSLMHRVRAGLLGLGIEPLLLDGESSCVLNAFRLPKGLDYATLHDHLKRAGYVIYAGQGEFAQSIFRIAVMGALADDDIEHLLRAIRSIV
ncbi:2-aminoethylphosphonate aminotransferase [Nitrococcus mobilis]|uniref:2-aminoethylphosphonate--pyruvate transaminase n=1 Tax=Nitrococcus mobilis Nb-231 TaxID=314278 RepID=A4BTB9_9GAMM|nr:2-aminoethylphosphonate aminotransferase [Nitrococcus mobilis]EAR21021.1 Aminotransferase, class V [Nitrococcus mobilis Nb-231]